jgi:hypothetical protein
MCLTGAVLLDRNTHEHNVHRNMHTTECDAKYICLFDKTDRHDITEILLKVALNTIKHTNKQIYFASHSVVCIEETEDPEKTTDLSQVTEQLYQIMWYTSP